MNWKVQFEHELEQAQKARQAGNEGMARVCARRAVGALVGAYLERNHLPDVGPSAYDRLRYLAAYPELDPHIQETLTHFLSRVTPDHQLPIDADLIGEARWLAEQLIEP